MLINDNASTNTATSTNDAPKPEPANSTSAVTKESAVRLIENLVNERQQWQEAVYKTSNDMLYGLLQRCYGLYSTMCEKNNDGKAAREGFALYLERNKLAFKKGTHTLTMIVRCVFGNERRYFTDPHARPVCQQQRQPVPISVPAPCNDSQSPLQLRF